MDPTDKDAPRPESADDRMRMLRLMIEELELENERLLQRIERANQTLSYQLGAALIHGTTSARGLAELPGNLWRLRREALARRMGGNGSTRGDKPSASQRAWVVVRSLLKRSP